MSGKAFIDHFSALEDPRQAWKVVYPLPEILLVVLCATLGGAEDFVEVARWGQRKLDFLRRLLPYERGIASHDTLTDVMNALPAALFAECFTAWVESLRESAPDIVAIDGKTSRRSKAKGSDPLHLVSAWASRQRAPLTNGLLATGGGLVFSGDLDRNFKAYDAESGELLWSSRLGDSPSAPAITFTANGRQYIAVTTGHGRLADARSLMVPEIKLPTQPTGILWVFEVP